MRGRRRLLKATLAALAALVLLGGIGAGVWVASSDDDEVPAVFAAAPPETETPAEEPAPADSPEDAPPPAPDSEATAPTPTTATEPEPEPEPELETPAPAEPQPGRRPEKTRFPRERRKDPDRRGRRFSVPPAHQFTGNGNALIGTVDVRRPALVKWKARGRFGLEFGQEAFPIIAPSKSGQLVVPPYRFELVRVFAQGPWTITVTPQ
jgi:hypothetical protein